jgi:hypothetical protein
MNGRHRVLIAAQPSAWAVLKTMLGDLADLFPARTTADAFKILERERIDLIVCTIAFDESQMMQFLKTVKTISAGHIPFLCARVLPGIVRDSLVPSIRDGCKALGAADLVDIARLPTERAQAAMRAAVEASISIRPRAASGWSESPAPGPCSTDGACLLLRWRPAAAQVKRAGRHVVRARRAAAWLPRP